MYGKVLATTLTCLFISGVSIGHSRAGEVQVVGADISQESNGLFRFSVTLRHGDNGWDHYADRWQVLSPAGDVLATRVLAHPHESEQPFTRALSGVAIPENITWVQIRGHDKVHGDSPDVLKEKLPGR